MNLPKKFNITQKLSLILILLVSLSLNGQAQDLAEKVLDRLGNYYDQVFEVTSPAPGHVIIEGKVKTLYDKYRIFEIASFVKGVDKITNNIIVDTEILPDQMIANNTRHEMKYVDAILEPEEIRVHADNGVIFLEGTVNFYREKLMAQTVASWQEGVRGIVNNLEVLPPEKARSDENLRDIFQSILDERFGTEENVSFTVKDGFVTLQGKTTDLWAKNQIEEVISGIRGVKKVENNIELMPQ